jgi:hypothetical protein
MISIIFPTRNRPNELLRLIESFRLHSNVQPEILCYVDYDDHSYDGRLFDAQIIRGPQLVLSAYWDTLLRFATGDLLMASADDVICRTPGWDGMVEGAFAQCPDKILMVFGNDGGPDGTKYPTSPIVHRRWIETVGRWIPPYFCADYIDTWLYDVAKRINRIQFVPFTVEHIHPIWNKAPLDETYRRGNERRQAQEPWKAFELTARERESESEALRAAMDSSWRPS